MTRPGIMSERLISLFLLGALLFSPPLLLIFDLPETVGGFPPLYLFLFVAWSGVIILAALTVESAEQRLRGAAARDQATPAGGER